MAKKEERFIKVYSENLGCEVIYVDRNGKPIVSPLPVEEK